MAYLRLLDARQAEQTRAIKELAQAVKEIKAPTELVDAINDLRKAANKKRTGPKPKPMVVVSARTITGAVQAEVTRCINRITQSNAALAKVFFENAEPVSVHTTRDFVFNGAGHVPGGRIDDGR